MQGGTILIVDDDPEILEALAEILSGEGFTTLRAKHGQEALDLIEHTRPDLMLLDLMMPVMDGYELSCQLRKLRIDPPIPIVVISADRSVRVKSSQMGAFGFLAKPFELADLLRVVAAVPDVPRQPDLPAEVMAPERPAPRRDVYPYVMGGLLHDALNAVTSMQYFCNKTSGGPVAEANVLQRVKSGLERISRVMRLMQDVSRAHYAPEQQGRAQEAPEEVLSQYRRSHPSISYFFSQSGPLDLPAGISTFLVGELLENATRACEAVSSPRIELRLDVQNDGTMSIDCTDTGRGFPEAMIERICSGQIPRRDGVTLGGHGLYLMKEVAERLNGKLLCANREEGGARVQILITPGEQIGKARRGEDGGEEW